MIVLFSAAVIAIDKLLFFFSIIVNNSHWILCLHLKDTAVRILSALHTALGLLVRFSMWCLMGPFISLGKDSVIERIHFLYNGTLISYGAMDVALLCIR